MSSSLPSWLFQNETTPALLKEVLMIASNTDLKYWKEKFQNLELRRQETASKHKTNDARNLFRDLQPFRDTLVQVKSGRPYIPKFNTFKREKNQDYHLEIGDEAFDQANISVNQIRSRLLAKKLLLTPETLVSIFNEEVKPEYIHLTKQWMSKHAAQDESFFALLKDHPAVYNYSHLTQWNEEQQTDVIKQLWGEQETVTLTEEAVLQECFFCIQQFYQKESKKQEQIEVKEYFFPTHPKDYKFMHMYLHYLALIDDWLFDSTIQSQNPILSTYLESNAPILDKHLSISFVGYLVQNYFIPWKYTSYMQLHEEKLANLIQPWQVVLDNGVQNELLLFRVQRYHQRIDTNKKNLLFGRQLLDGSQSSIKEQAMVQHVKELEMAVGKKQNFYSNEKKRFLLSAKQSELESIQNYLQRYAWRLQMHKQVNLFFKERVLNVAREGSKRF